MIAAVLVLAWVWAESSGNSALLELPKGGGAHRRRLMPNSGVGGRLDDHRRDYLSTPEVADVVARSLRGSDIDGALPLDESGHLIVSPAVRRFFEYFFAASGEVNESRLRQAIEEEIGRRLGEPARLEALELLEKFLSYRRRGRDLDQGVRGGGDLAQRAEAVARLRVALFGSVAAAAALFEDEDDRARFAAKMYELSRDETLSVEERARRLRELAETMPESIRRSREAARAPQRLARDEQELRAAGGSEDEVRALREQRFGAAAAERLAQLDQRRSGWRRRVDDFRRLRSVIESDIALTPSQKKERVERLIDEGFSATERLRLGALDRVELGR